MYHIGKLKGKMKKGNYWIFVIKCIAVIFFVTSTAWLFKAFFLESYPDFRGYYYGPYYFLKGINPYEGAQLLHTQYVYPPIVLLLFSLLTFLPYGIAQSLWLVISFVCYGVSLYLLSKIFGLRFFSTINLLFVSLASISFPVKFTFGMGQINHVILLFLVIALLLLKKKKDFYAGVFLGISLAIKLFPLFLPLYFFFYSSFDIKKDKIVELKKRGAFIFSIAHRYIWVKPRQILQNLKVLTGIIAVGVVSVLLMFMFVPRMLNEYFIFEILPSFFTSWKLDYYNQALSGFIGRSLGTGQFETLIKLIISFIISTGVIYIITKNKRLDFATVSLKFGLLITVSLILNNFSWQHHFVWLIIPFYATFYYLQRFGFSKKYFAGLIISYLLVSTNFNDPLVLPTLFQSHVFYGTLVLLALNIRLLFLKNEK